MTHMTDEQIEDTFIQVREKFEKTENAFGLEMLNSIEDRWEAIGELSDKQLSWLDRQVNQSWKRKKARATSETATLPEQADGQVLVSAGLLAQLARDIQRISQVLDHLRGQHAA